MTSESAGNYALLDELADEFAARYRRGERPALQEYVDRHPDLADDIRELFPALVKMEQVKDDCRAAAVPVAEPPLQQLGDYRLLREIGRGGMGVVYEAEQASLGRRVALKVLPAKLLADPKYRRRFEREARAVAKLHHTNIVPVFGVGEQDGIPYYAMQFIPGLGIDQVIDELKRLQSGSSGAPVVPPGAEARATEITHSLLRGAFRTADKNADEAIGEHPEDTIDTPLDRLPETPGSIPASATGQLAELCVCSSAATALPGQQPEAAGAATRRPTYWQSVATIGVQVADALAHAHKQGILHRDVKPSNLLLDKTGTVWITDFGLAKTNDQQDLTDTGDLLGTLRYMPPEAFEGRADARSDVYALGLTLYELLALRPTFDEPERGQLIKQVTTAEPARLGRLNPTIPRDLVTIVQKGIEREPAHRYQTAGELAADLQRSRDDEPILARRLSLRERLGRWARRNKGVAAALSVVGLLLVLIAVGAGLAAAHFSQQEEEQRALAQKNEKLADEKEAARGRAEKARTEAEIARQREAELRQQAEEARQREARLRQLAERQGAELRRNLYLAEVHLATQAADSPTGILRINELLAKWRHGQPDLRGWEWYYLTGLGQRDLATLRGHTEALATVAWSPDGKRLASAGLDQTILIHDATRGYVVEGQSK